MKASVTETLAQIKATHSVAGIVLHDDVVVETAPRAANAAMVAR